MPPTLPRWFKSDRNQAVAEWLYFHTCLDRLVGREPSPSVWPYNQHNPSVVTTFLARLEAEGW